MKVQVTERFTFEAAHRICDSRPEYANLHGHSHEVLVTLAGEVSLPQGWLIEQRAFRRLVNVHVGRLDHCYLNEILDNVTAEGIASHLFHSLSRSDFPSGVGLKSVEVRKTTTRAKVTA